MAELVIKSININVNLSVNMNTKTNKNTYINNQLTRFVNYNSQHIKIFKRMAPMFYLSYLTNCSNSPTNSLTGYLSE